MIRSIGSITLGFIVALILVMAFEGISAVVHPFPDGFEGTPEEMHAHVAKYPSWVLSLCVVFWGATVLVSTWLATRFGRNRHPIHGLILGLILLALVIFNMYLLPYPLWFEAANVLVFSVCIFLGIRLGQSNPKQPDGSIAEGDSIGDEQHG